LGLFGYAMVTQLHSFQVDHEFSQFEGNFDSLLNESRETLESDLDFDILSLAPSFYLLAVRISFLNPGSSNQL